MVWTGEILHKLALDHSKGTNALLTNVFTAFLKHNDICCRDRTASAECLHVKLLTSVMVYCWPSLNQRFKDKLFKRVRQGMQVSKVASRV